MSKLSSFYRTQPTILEHIISGDLLGKGVWHSLRHSWTVLRMSAASWLQKQRLGAGSKRVLSL